MSIITQDGVEYEVELSDQSLYNMMFVTIWALDESLVASAEINHNAESITVTYKCSDGDYVDGTYPYHEFASDDKENKLAQWLVATHPEN